jgi:hypothetical protein
MSGRGDIHPAGDQPADQPWARTADRHVWRAYKNGLMLTVTEAIGGGWHPVVEGPGVTRHGPVVGSRVAAQRWAEDQAGGAS